MIKVVIFDYGHTLLDTETDQLYPGVLETLEFIDQKNIKLVFISATDKEEYRRQELNDFGIFPYFQYVEFLSHQETKDFRPIIDLFKVSPEEVLVVGDRITSEITEANKLGMKTCRVLKGPEKNLIPSSDLEKADFEIENISEVRDLINA